MLVGQQLLHTRSQVHHNVRPLFARESFGTDIFLAGTSCPLL